MRLLLDTCALVWLATDPERLSTRASNALSAGENELFVHQLSTWEIQIKHALGKLRLSIPPSVFVPEAIERHGVAYVELKDADIFHVGKLPDLHRDPIDRLLVAHALLNGLTIVTPDPQIARYPAPVLW